MTAGHFPHANQKRHGIVEHDDLVVCCISILLRLVQVLFHGTAFKVLSNPVLLFYFSTEYPNYTVLSRSFLAGHVAPQQFFTPGMCVLLSRSTGPRNVATTVRPRWSFDPWAWQIGKAHQRICRAERVFGSFGMKSSYMSSYMIHHDSFDTYSLHVYIYIYSQSVITCLMRMLIFIDAS